MSAPVSPGQGQGMGCSVVLGAAVVAALFVAVLVSQLLMAVGR